MRRAAIPYLLLFFVLPVWGQRQLQLCSPSPEAQRLPRLPLQLTRTVQFQATAEPTAKLAVSKVRLLTVPRDRFLLVDSVVMKGTHPAKAYLAFELQVSLGEWSRHFLYTAQTGEQATVLQARTTLRAVAAPDSSLLIGMQKTKEAIVEPITVTITGFLIDRCLYGQ